MKNKCLLTLLLCCCSAVAVWAVNVRGVVRDAKTGEILTGAVIRVKNSGIRCISGLDGSFVLRNVASGRIVLLTSMISYQALEKTIVLSSDKEENISLELVSYENELSHITVVGTSKTSDVGVRSMERLAPNVVNMISAKAIELSPDVTVANVLQRISGVTVERSNSGDGQYAILRGMDKRYNYTLVNGIKIPSPDNKNRFVPLDIFPAEMLDRLEVTKSLTPEMEGDAIGGAVNMVMKEAPARFALSVNLSTGYNSLFFDRDFQHYDTKSVARQSPYEKYGAAYPARFKDFSTGVVRLQQSRPLPNLSGGFSVGNRFLHQKLGMMLAGSYQQTNRGNNSIFFSSETASSDASNLPVLKDYRKRNYSEAQLRYGLHARLDYHIAPQHKLQLYSAFINLTNTQVRDERSIDLITGYNPAEKDYNVSYSTRFRTNTQTIFTNTLHGSHGLLNKLLLVNWDAVYSKANNRTPNNTAIHTLSTVRGGEEKFVSVNTLNGESVRWEHNTDEDKAAYLNAQVAPEKVVSATVGGMFRSKDRNSFFNEYTLTPFDPATGSTNLIKGVDWNDYTQIKFAVKNPYGSTGDPLNYAASEKISAGFVQLKYEKLKWKIVGGLRLEHTLQGYHLANATEGARNNGEQQYNDWLPAINLKYSPRSNQNVRASYYRSINRPSFFEIVPYNIVNEDFTEKGNPDLKHTVADNVDFRYEFFPKPAEQLMAGIFYKRIQNPIEYGMVPTGQGTFFMPDNFGVATNYGLELDAIKYFNAVGIKANYTYTHSEISTTKLFNYANENSGSSANILTRNMNQTRPLYGQSPSVANLALLYKNGQHNVDAQLNAVYTGRRLFAVSRYYENDLWQKETVQLDASLEKRWGRCSLFAKATNLLNAPMIVYLKKNNATNEKVAELEHANGGTLVRKDYYGLQFQLGMRLKID